MKYNTIIEVRSDEYPELNQVALRQVQDVTDFDRMLIVLEGFDMVIQTPSHKELCDKVIEKLPSAYADFGIVTSILQDIICEETFKKRKSIVQREYDEFMERGITEFKCDTVTITIIRPNKEKLMEII